MKLFRSLPTRQIFVGLFATISTVGMVQTASAADAKPTIPIIVKDTTSNYWQIVLAGARKAGKDPRTNIAFRRRGMPKIHHLVHGLVCDDSRVPVNTLPGEVRRHLLPFLLHLQQQGGKGGNKWVTASASSMCDGF